MRNGVWIEGVFVSFDELRNNVKAAKKKGLSHKWAFCPETVEALLNFIERNLKKEDIRG